MSQITENTIVVKPEAEIQLVQDLQKASGLFFRVRNIKCVFKNKNYVVYVFDANGDVPWEVTTDRNIFGLNINGDVLGVETVYGEGDRWTRVLDKKKGFLVDTNWWLATYMKRNLSAKEFEVYRKGTQYTMT